MAAPHFRIVRPNNVGRMSTLLNTRIFVTFPGHEEIELNTIRGVTFEMHIESPDIVRLEMFGSTEMEISHGNEEG